jgi:hypothetical protein
MSPPWFVRGGPNLAWDRFGWALLHCGEQFCTDVHCKRRVPSHSLKAAPHRKCSVAMEKCHGRCETLPRLRGRVPVGGQNVPTRLPKHACFYRHLLAFACLPGRGDRRAACELDTDANLWNPMNSQCEISCEISHDKDRAERQTNTVRATCSRFF